MGLAVAMIAFLVLGLWAHTGTMPPLVVVESSSMIHEENGEVGSIDAGDSVSYTHLTLPTTRVV